MQEAAAFQTPGLAIRPVPPMTLSTGSGEVEAAGGERSPAAATLGQQTSGQAASPGSVTCC